jgi:hypothetical protein
MAKLGIADELCELIKTVDVAPDELSMVVANYFGRAWIPGGREVFYRSEDEEVALRLTYARSGQLVAALAGPALTNQAAREAARLGPLLRDPPTSSSARLGRQADHRPRGGGTRSGPRT